MRIYFSGTGECKVNEIIQMNYVPPEGATINFYVNEGDDDDVEWTVRTVVHCPKNQETIGDMGPYDVYAVVGSARPDWM